MFARESQVLTGFDVTDEAEVSAGTLGEAGLEVLLEKRGGEAVFRFGSLTRIKILVGRILRFHIFIDESGRFVGLMVKVLIVIILVMILIFRVWTLVESGVAAIKIVLVVVAELALLFALWLSFTLVVGIWLLEPLRLLEFLEILLVGVLIFVVLVILVRIIFILILIFHKIIFLEIGFVLMLLVHFFWRLARFSHVQVFFVFVFLF